MMSVGHVLNHVPDHVSDHMIIGLVATALHIFPHSSLPPGKRWLPLVTHVTPARDLTQSQLTELSQLNKSLGFLQKRNFLEHQRPEVSSRDVSRDFFHSR